MKKIISVSLVAAALALTFQGCQPQLNWGEQDDKPSYIEKPLPAKLTLSNFSANKPLLFRPFNKFSSAKKIYFSFVGQATDFIDIKSKIESNLKHMGYHISADKRKSDLYVAVYMLGDRTTPSNSGINYYEDKEYNFNIILEQHVKGKTTLSETYDIDGKNSGTSKSFQASANLSAHHSKNINSAYTSMSDDGVSLFGSYSKGNKAMVSGKGKNKLATKKVDTVAVNHRSIKSKTELGYYLFKDEINVKAKFETLNMQSQEAKTNKMIGDKLALRLAKLLDF